MPGPGPHSPVGGRPDVGEDAQRLGGRRLRRGRLLALRRRLAGLPVLRTDLALDAREVARWTRRTEPRAGLLHHSACGGQELAIRYTERLAEVGAVPSVGSRGDRSDHALAESFNGLYKPELLPHAGSWRGLEAVEYATLEEVAGFNHRRLHGELGLLPPAEFEATFDRAPAPALLASSQ